MYIYVYIKKGMNFVHYTSYPNPYHYYSNSNLPTQHTDYMLRNQHYLNHYSNQLYGVQPTFQGYQGHLQQAYESGIESYGGYRNPQSFYQNGFYDVPHQQFEQTTRLEATNEQAIRDYGSNPYVVDIEKVTKQNETFRTALWTGKHLQLTLMSINVGEDIGLEVHPNLDQFIRIEDGEGLVQMGDSKDNLTFQKKAIADYAIFVPAGKWHNLTNTGNKPIKLYSIYAPPEHPFGTVHATKEIAMAAEEHH